MIQDLLMLLSVLIALCLVVWAVVSFVRRIIVERQVTMMNVKTTLGKMMSALLEMG